MHTKLTCRIDHPNPTLHHLMPPRNTLRFPISQSTEIPKGYESIVDALRISLSCIEGVIVEEHGAGQQLLEEEEPDQATLKDRPQAQEFLVRALCDSWSRRARRSTKRERRDSDAPGSSINPLPANNLGDELELGTMTMSSFFDSAALVCICIVRRSGHQVQGQPEMSLVTLLEVEFRWVYGKDRALFESFVSHVKRRMVSSG